MIKCNKVDLIQVQWWEVIVVCDVGYDLVYEWEDLMWVFDQQEWMQLFLWYVFDLEDVDVVQFQYEKDVIVFFCF